MPDNPPDYQKYYRQMNKVGHILSVHKHYNCTLCSNNSIHPIASARMSPQNTCKLMGFCMEVLILSVILQYMVSASLSC